MSQNGRMKAVGAPHTLLVFDGQGHGFGGEHGKKAAEATWEFFDRHLKRCSLDRHPVAGAIFSEVRQL